MRVLVTTTDDVLAAIETSMIFYNEKTGALFFKEGENRVFEVSIPYNGLAENLINQAYETGRLDLSIYSTRISN